MKATGYVLIWLALLALTFATWALHKLDLGALSVVLAFAIAATKAGLVLAFFMHLKEHAAVNRAFVALSFLFLALLIGFTVVEVKTRFHTSTPAGAPFKEVPGVGYSGPLERERD